MRSFSTEDTVFILSDSRLLDPWKNWPIYVVW